MRALQKLQRVMFQMLCFFLLCFVGNLQAATLESYQKISSTEGGLTGGLPDNGWFGTSVTFLGNLGAGAPTSLAIAVGSLLDGKGSVRVLFLDSNGNVAAQQRIAEGVGGLNTVISGDAFGTSVASIGDLDGDGIKDLAVGQQFSNAGGPHHGAVWILLLHADGSVKDFKRFSDDGSGGFPVGILDFNDSMGSSVAFLGDLNNDGHVELAVGANGDDDGVVPTDNTQPGAVYILSLNPDGTLYTTTNPDGSIKYFQKISKTQGLVSGGGLPLRESDLFGTSIANIGDINGDGINDMAVGAIFDDPVVDDPVNSRFGAVWVLLLNADGQVSVYHKIDKPTYFDSVLSSGDDFGGSINNVGDLDNNGINDLIVGSVGVDDGGLNRGAIWILHLNNNGTLASAPEKISNTSGGFTGVLDNLDGFGNAVSLIPGLHGNGIVDVAVGAPRDDDGGNNRGAVWMLSLRGSNQRPVANAGSDIPGHPGQTETLSGLESSDPDMNYPLSYLWTVTVRPSGSSAELINPTSVNPSFTPDVLGEYRIQLVATDSLGAVSLPDEMIINTENTAPIADAGSDQHIVLIGSTVPLNGMKSYDFDGDGLSYFWSFVSKPSNSNATIDNPNSPTPSFIADVHGDYVVGLVVTDLLGAVSEQDTVTIGFDNIRPVADAGMNGSVVLGQAVTLDGTNSHDENADPLTYTWSIVYAPTGSMAVIESPHSPVTQFTPDLEGSYVLSLMVNDGFEDSEVPSNITIVALSINTVITQEINGLVAEINVLDIDVFKNGNMKNALTNKLNAVLVDVANGQFALALSKLQNDIIKKTDGCAANRNPDANDWIETCIDGQDEIYPLIQNIIALLQSL